ACSRDCSMSFAAEPAPPATAPLMNSMSGYCSLNTSTRASSPTFSEPAAHQVNTSTELPSPPPEPPPHAASPAAARPLPERMRKFLRRMGSPSNGSRTPALHGAHAAPAQTSLPVTILRGHARELRGRLTY